MTFYRYVRWILLIFVFSSIMGCKGIEQQDSSDTPERILRPLAYPADISNLPNLFVPAEIHSNGDIEHLELVDRDIPPNICGSIDEITRTFYRDCAQLIEDFQFSQGLLGIERSHQKLGLTLKNGDVMTLTHTAHSGKGSDPRYIRYIPELDSHLLNVQYTEGTDFMLIHATTGEMIHMGSPPILASDGKHFFTMFYMFQAELYVSIWQVAEDAITRQRLVKLKNPDGIFRPQLVKWRDEMAFEIDVHSDGHLWDGNTIGTFRFNLDTEDNIGITFNGNIVEYVEN